MTWKANVRTSDLTAMRQNKELVWQQPIVLTLDARETKDGPVIDNLKCESHFLTINAAGRREDLAASLEFDLDRLVERLGGFIELDGLKMKGKRLGQPQLAARSPERLHARRQRAGPQPATGAVRPPAVAGREPRRASRLDRADHVRDRYAAGHGRVGAQGRLGATPPAAHPAGRRAQAGRLVAPGPGHARAIWRDGLFGREPGTCSTTGTSPATYHLQAEGTASASGVALRSSRLDVEQLRMVGHGLNLVEPTVALTAVGQYLHGDRRMLLSKAELNTPTLTVNASDVIVGVPERQADGTGRQRVLSRRPRPIAAVDRRARRDADLERRPDSSPAKPG